MQNIYCDEMEREDAEIFESFSEDRGWFSEKLKFNKNGSRLDAIGITKNGRKINIEIKQRCGEYGDFYKFISKFDTIFLDYGKLNAFSETMKTSGATAGDGAIFVSIFNNGDVILVHNLNQKELDSKHYGNKRVWNEASKEWDIEYKEGFYWYDASVYFKEGEHYRKLKEDDIMDLRMSYSKVDETQICKALNLIIAASHLYDSSELKQHIAAAIQDNADIINQYLQMDLTETEFL